MRPKGPAIGSRKALAFVIQGLDVQIAAGIGGPAPVMVLPASIAISRGRFGRKARTSQRRLWSQKYGHRHRPGHRQMYRWAR